MLDQATRLRELAAAYRAQVLAPALSQPVMPVRSRAAEPAPVRRTTAIAVTSGKGGVGKTNISINLAHALMAGGKDVLLLDADLGLANADILLGTVPPYHLGHLLRGERTMRELIHRTPSGLKLIAGGSGVDELANLPEKQLQTFVGALRELEGEADYLILDTGAGLSNSVLSFVLASDQVLVVTTPEPTSLADGYATIKTLVQRHPQVAIKLVVNQAERLDEASQAAERIITTARNFLGHPVELLGTVPRDPHVWQAVRQQTPFFLGYPGSPAARAMSDMVGRLVPDPDRTARPGATGFFDRLASFFSRKAV